MKILKYPDPFLRNKAADVTIEEIQSKAMKNFLAEMSVTMTMQGGLGLAAAQVGDPRNVFLYLTKNERVEPLFNAKIIARGGKQKILGEGCLSIPNFKRDTQRSKMVIVIALDSNSNKIRIKTYGMESATFQHEIDHLNGKLFIDHIKNEKKRQQIYQALGGKI